MDQLKELVELECYCIRETVVPEILPQGKSTGKFVPVLH
jgi:hypothetical protein